MPKLYCPNIFDVEFGEGPLGIHLGMTENRDVIVAGFTENPYIDCYPIEVLNKFLPFTVVGFWAGEDWLYYPPN